MEWHVEKGFERNKAHVFKPGGTFRVPVCEIMYAVKAASLEEAPPGYPRCKRCQRIAESRPSPGEEPSGKTTP